MSEPEEKDRSSCVIALVILVILIVSIVYSVRNPGPPLRPDQCGRCNGSGMIDADSFFEQRNASCPSCGGVGTVPSINLFPNPPPKTPR